MVSITDKKWDILILLDACRYKEFEQYNPYNGTLSKAEGCSSGTKSWLQQNFKDKDCSDVVYINPVIYLTKWLPNSNFYRIVPTWEICWDNQYGTILPEDTTKTALGHINLDSEKRYIVHYTQPHLPFLSVSSELTKQNTIKDRIYKQKNHGKQLLSKSLNTLKINLPSVPFWYLERWFGNNAGIGEIYFKDGFEGIHKAYVENLKRVLSAIKPIIENNNKKIVITADHGEKLGEKGMIGHKGRSKVVMEIPWFEVGN